MQKVLVRLALWYLRTQNVQVKQEVEPSIETTPCPCEIPYKASKQYELATQWLKRYAMEFSDFPAIYESFFEDFAMQLQCHYVRGEWLDLSEVCSLILSRAGSVEMSRHMIPVWQKRLAGVHS